MSDASDIFDPNFPAKPADAASPQTTTRLSKKTVQDNPVSDRIKRDAKSEVSLEMQALGKEVDLQELAKKTGKYKKKVKVVKESQLKEMIEHILDRFLREREITISQEERERLQKQAGADLGRSMKQVQSLQEELDDALVAKVDMEMALEKAQSELADLNKRFALLKDRLEDEEAKNAELEATLAEREQSLTALDEEVTEARDHLDAYQTLEPQVASLKTMIHVVGEESVSDAELSARCRQFDDPEEVLVVGAAALDDLRMSLAAAKEGRRNLANDNDKLTSQIAGLQQQLDAASSSVAASQGVTAADREANAAAVAERDAMIAKARSERDAKISELADLRAEHARLQGIVDGSKAWQDDMKATSAEQKAALAQQQQQLAEQKETLAQQQQQLAQQTEALQNSEEEAGQLRQEIEKLQGDMKATSVEQEAALAQQQQQLAQQKEALQNSEDEAAQLRQEIEKLQAELAVTKGKLLRTPTPSDWLHWDFAVDKSKNYAFVNDDGQVHLLRGAQGEWTHANLSEIVEEKSGAPVEPARSGCITGYAPQHCQHVIYTGEDGSLREMWSEEDDWHQENLTEKTGAPQVNGRPSALYVQGRNVIIYQDVAGDLQALSFTNEWRHRPVPGGEQANAGRGVHLKEDGDILVLAWRDATGDPKMLRLPLAELPS